MIAPTESVLTNTAATITDRGQCLKDEVGIRASSSMGVSPHAPNHIAARVASQTSDRTKHYPLVERSRQLPSRVGWPPRTTAPQQTETPPPAPRNRRRRELKVDDQQDDQGMGVPSNRDSSSSWMMMRGVTIIIRLSVSRPMPTLRNNRLM
jgi:hypothetical protein